MCCSSRASQAHRFAPGLASSAASCAVDAGKHGSSTSHSGTAPWRHAGPVVQCRVQTHSPRFPWPATFRANWPVRRMVKHFSNWMDFLSRCIPVECGPKRNGRVASDQRAALQVGKSGQEGRQVSPTFAHRPRGPPPAQHGVIQDTAAISSTFSSSLPVLDSFWAEIPIRLPPPPLKIILPIPCPISRPIQARDGQVHTVSSGSSEKQRKARAVRASPSLQSYPCQSPLNTWCRWAGGLWTDQMAPEK